MKDQDYTPDPQTPDFDEPNEAVDFPEGRELRGERDDPEDEETDEDEERTLNLRHDDDPDEEDDF